MPIYISSSCELISSKSMLSSFSSSYKFFFFINIFFIIIKKKKKYLFLFFYVSITFSLSFLLSFTNVKVKYLVCSTNFIRKKKKKKKLMDILFYWAQSSSPIFCIKNKSRNFLDSNQTKIFTHKKKQ